MKTFQEFQTQWEVAVNLIYVAAMEFLKCPSLYLKVVGEDRDLDELQSQKMSCVEAGITDTQVCFV